MVFRISRGPYITSFHLLSRLNLGRSNRSNWSVHYARSTAALPYSNSVGFCPSLVHRAILACFNKRWKRVISKWPACGSRGKMAGTLLPSFLRWSISYKVSNRNATLRVEWLYMTLIIFHESSDFLKWNTGFGWLLQTKITVLGNKDQFPIVFWGCYTFSRAFGKHIGCL